MVRFGHGLDEVDVYGGNKVSMCKLFGNPWPSEELRALFGLMPDTIQIDWVRGLGYFEVTSRGRRMPVSADEGHSVIFWQRVFAELLK